MDRYDDGQKEKENIIIRDESSAYGRRAHDGYTIDDYFATSEDQNVELIDGTFFDMASPGVRHQGIVMKVSVQLENYVSEKGGRCRVFAGPIDVQLDCDDKTVVVPDIIVVCDTEKLQKDRVKGAPDLVVEIVSPSSTKRDYVIKTEKYSEAGVCEYWIVDPEKERVLVYDFEGDSVPVMYGLDDEVPVGIFDGELKIKFPADI